MTFEEKLRSSLHRADEFVPSADLFAKVQRSIEEDAAHRRRGRRVWAAVGAGVAALAAYVAGFADVAEGTVSMPWWSVEVLLTGIEIAIVITLGPLIRRFGLTYVESAFGVNPPTGERFLAVLDIAYYLVFSALILARMRFSPDPAWDSLGEQIETTLGRLGGLLLAMGVLHAITISVLPLVGLIASSTWRRAARTELGREVSAPSPQAEAADRLVSIVVWSAAALLLMAVMVLAVGLVLGTSG